MTGSWLVLLAVVGGALVVGAGLEAYALWSRRRGDTLSEVLRPFARRHPGVVVGVCGVLAGLLLWLPGHLGVG